MSKIGIAVAIALPFAAGGSVWIMHQRLSCPAPIAFIGDSNVVAMDLGPGCINLGVGGDTSQNMARRFIPSDLSGSKTLVIWASQNDFRRGLGVRYYREMATKAQTAGMRVVLATPPPTSADSMAALSGEIRNLGAAAGLPVVDLNRTLSLPGGAPNIVLYRWEFQQAMPFQHLNRVGRWLVWHKITAAIKP